MKTPLDSTLCVLLPGGDPVRRESYHQFTLRELMRVFAEGVAGAPQVAAPPVPASAPDTCPDINPDACPDCGTAKTANSRGRLYCHPCHARKVSEGRRKGQADAEAEAAPSPPALAEDAAPLADGGKWRPWADREVRRVTAAACFSKFHRQCGEFTVFRRNGQLMYRSVDELRSDDEILFNAVLDTDVPGGERWVGFYGVDFALSAPISLPRGQGQEE